MARARPPPQPFAPETEPQPRGCGPETRVPQPLGRDRFPDSRTQSAAQADHGLARLWVGRSSLRGTPTERAGRLRRFRADHGLTPMALLWVGQASLGWRPPAAGHDRSRHIRGRCRHPAPPCPLSPVPCPPPPAPTPAAPQTATTASRRSQGSGPPAPSRPSAPIQPKSIRAQTSTAPSRARLGPNTKASKRPVLPRFQRQRDAGFSSRRQSLVSFSPAFANIFNHLRLAPALLPSAP